MLLHGLGPLLATLLVILGWSVFITAIVDLGSENYRYCDMSQFQNTYFHTVTCDGYVRVKMEDYDSFEAMNKEIDKILENRTILHPEPCDVRAFYHNETHWIFLRMSDRKVDRPSDKLRRLEFWMNNLQGKEGFVSFPANETWTSMGAAFSSFTQYAHSFFINTNFSLPASTSRFCKPYDWFYDYKKKGIGIKLACANCQYPLMTYPEQWTSIYDPKNNEKTACSYECLSQQLDPIAYKYRDHRWVSCGGNDISDVYSQIYRVFYVYAITDGKDVYSKLWIPNATKVDVFFSNPSSHYPNSDGSFCWLRKFRLDYNEEPYAFMLPKFEGLPLVGPKVETPTMDTSPTSTETTIDEDEDDFEEPYECEAGMDGDECEEDENED